MLDKLKKEDFEPRVDETFEIEVAEGEPIAVELIEVQALVPADDEADRRPPFSLIFRGPADAPLAQGIFKLRNDAMGELKLFMVTIGPDKEGLRHEVIFT